MSEARNRNRRRWGIIYSPKIGATRPMGRWKEISEYLAEKEVAYDFFCAGSANDVECQALKYANNGFDTVVVIGGDGALQDALNGLLASGRANEVALGIVPNGIENDFASYWGLSFKDYKMAVDSIIAGRVRKVDVGCCCYYKDGVEVKRYFINVLNVGLSANIVALANKKSTIFAKIIYRFRALLHLLFRRQNFNMKFRLNNQLVDRKFMMLCIGNSTGYGMTPSAVPYNGWMDVSAIRMSPFLGVLKGLQMVTRRRILNFELVEPFRTTEIEIESVGGAGLGIDGRPFAPTFPLLVTVEPEKLNLIIPTKIKKRL
ncbi:MAG: lipid kinase [Bacteroidaceae bacterium]|nr:lipid kinase [Bacteroidaceae bacterium]